jgi:hypothetical protein
LPNVAPQNTTSQKDTADTATSAVTLSTSSALLAAANPDRAELFLSNDHATQVVYLSLGGGSKLLDAVDASQTIGLKLQDATGFPTSGTILIDTEQITYTGRSGPTLTGVTRAANGSSGAIHAAGAVVSGLVAAVANQGIRIGPASVITIGSHRGAVLGIASGASTVVCISEV